VSIVSRWGQNLGPYGRLQSSEGIAIDGRGHVYVADTGNNRIVKFSAGGAVMETWGSTGYGKLTSPQGVATDSADNVYVADAKSNRIVKFSQP
jgi:tripartite motif-containing protein 71